MKTIDLSDNDRIFKKILVLQTAFIGDVVLTVPLVKAVKEMEPSPKVHFLTIPASRNLVETLSFVDRLWIIDKRGADRGISGLVRFARRLRAEKYDLALVPHRSVRSAVLVWWAGIPVRIGFDRSAAPCLFTHRVTYRSDAHEIERNLSLLGPLRRIPGRKILPEIVPDARDIEKVSRWMEEQHIGDGDSTVVLAPGSVWPTKRWLPEYWGKLGGLLHSKGYKVVLAGSANDRFLIPLIQEAAGIALPEAMGAFTLRQTAELIRRSRLLVSNDSAPTHLGVAVRTPVLTIFGPTVPAFGFYPYGDGNRIAGLEDLDCRPCAIHGGKKCPLGHFHCMRHLYPEMVFIKVEEMLNEFV